MYLIDKGIDNRLDKPYYGSTFPQRLEQGELWEYLVLLELEKLGLSAYRPQQTFPKQSKMYGLHQRDIHLRIDKVRRAVLEVKSRREPFKYQNVLIGDVAGWDKKQFTVTAVIVVCQTTGECRVASGESSEWVRVKSRALSYAIPIPLFSPLDVWADAIKQGLYNL